MKPTFLVIGAAKAGTTSFCKMLSLHPDVFLTDPKEPFFFCNDEIYAKGIDWYESLFDGGEHAVARGEGSAAYSMREVFPQTVERVAAYASGLKFIYLVREPFSRIESHWMELVDLDRFVRYDFDQAVRENHEILVQSGNYLRQLEAWYRCFPREAVKVVFFEELVSEPRTVLVDCLAHLGVDRAPVDQVSMDHENRASDKRVPNHFMTTKLGRRSARVIKRFFPEVVSRRLRRHLFFKRVSGRPAWNPVTRQWVKDQLKEDLEAFLEDQGKPANYWASLT